jgi:hypothetical protein
MFTFGADGRPAGSWGLGWWAGVGFVGRLRSCRVMVVARGRAVGAGRIVAWPGERVRLVLGGGPAGLGRRVGGGDALLGGVPAALALLGWESVGCSSFVLGLAGVEGVGDA